MGITSTGVFGYDGTGTATGTATALPTVATYIKYLVVQNAPTNTDNILVGATSSPCLVLTPGNSLTLIVGSPASIFIKAASGSPAFNWMATD